MSTPSGEGQVLGVTPDPPLGSREEGEEVSIYFRAAGEFSRSTPLRMRTPSEIRREYRGRNVGLVISFAFAVGLSIGFSISFGWVFAIFPAAMALISFMLMFWLNVTVYFRRSRGSAD